MARSRRAAQLVASSAPDAAAAAGAAVLAIAVGPAGAIAGAATAPVVSRVVAQFVRSVRAAGRARAASVIARAAHLAGLEPAVLAQRLQASPEHEELLVRTMRAAADAAADEKLVMLATSLGRAAQGTPIDAGREALFVRVIADLDLLHIHVLQRFGSSPVSVPLNSQSLELALPDLGESAAPVLATLVRHGLLAYSTPSVSGAYGGGGLTTAVWEVTPFGKAFLDRLALVMALLRLPEGSDG